MADVTINNLSYGLPSSGAFIPYTDNGVTLKVSPSGLFAKPGNTLLVGSDSLADLFPTTIDTNLLALSTYSAVIRGGWLLSITERNTSWGDPAARIGVLRSGAGNGWWLSHNIDGSGAIHQSTQGDRLLITSAGYVKMPVQPSFFAHYGGGESNITTFGKVNFTAVQHNIGNCYDPSTSRFTAPIDGRYFISTHTINTQGNNGATGLELYINGSRYTYTHNVNAHPQGVTLTIIYQANKGDYFEIYGRNYVANGSNGFRFPHFTGYLLG